MGNSDPMRSEAAMHSYGSMAEEARAGNPTDGAHPITGPASPPPSTIFSGGGEMGERIRSFDWSKTHLGSIEQWPQSLVMSIQIMLASLQPIWVGWSPELICFYNDPYKAILGGRHPSALGRPMREVWPELWEQLEPVLQRAMAGIVGSYAEEQLLIMQRHGFREETYYTSSFTPIPSEHGIGGIICASTDDTQRVIRQRRVRIIQDLVACGIARNADELCQKVKKALATNPKDVPFALVYLLDPSGQNLELMCAAGISRDHPAVPASMALSERAPWPVAQVLQSNSERLVDISHYPNLPCGYWTQPPDYAVVLPLIVGAEFARAGVVIAGLNPNCQWAERYRTFFSLVAGQISSALNAVRAQEAEHKCFEREQAARRDAENAMRAKDQFLATLSHELRTPLNPVLLIASDALTDPDLPQEIRWQFEVILKNIEVEAQLIDDLLDLSRITHGKLNLKIRTLDAHHVLQEALHTVQAQIENKHIYVTVQLNAQQYFISADPVRLQQIFWNILRNAIKFTPRGGTIGIETSNPDGKFAVKIIDSGIGMTPEELNKIFTAFAQGEHTCDISENYGGLGLGLAISKRLMELHSGTIQATSEGRGRGSVFTLEFPAVKG